jgi:ATP-dependent RNA helicase DDX19/DBP5
LPQLICKKIPEKAKIILISATLTKASREIVEKLSEARTFVESLTKTEALTLKNVKQFYIQCEQNERFTELDSLLKKVSATNILIFANSKVLLNKLHEHLEGQSYKVASVMSSSVDKAEQAERNQANITGFLQGKFRILIATNLLSRGVDMRKVTLVVNLELPRKFTDGQSERSDVVKVDVETYLHRVGRTGRYGDHGIAVNFVCTPNHKIMLDDIMGHYKNEIKLLKPAGYDEMEAELQGIDSYNVKKREHLGEDI